MTRKDFLLVARAIRDCTLAREERAMVAECVAAGIKQVYPAPFSRSEEIFLAVATSDPQLVNRQKEAAEIATLMGEKV